jgi:TP901 family phage tail tape measure protein
MNNLLKVAVMLTAYDAMSREVQAAVGKSKKELDGLQDYSKKMFAQGLGLAGAGATGFAFLGKATKDFADLQEGALDLRSTMTADGGIFNEKQFEKINSLAVQLGNQLPGTTSDFHAMFTAMINGGLNAENILSGVGESAAFLAIQLRMPYDEAGKFAAKMKEATGVADSEMMQFLDTIARTKQVGVDAQEMQYAFARSTGALKLMGIQGLEASKAMATVDAMLIKSGQSGETIGTGMTSIFKAMLDPSKMNALNAASKEFGFTMEFMDKKTGKFLGLENMMAQFDKMKNLTAEQKNLISSSFLGNGADSNFMNILADKGSAGFNAMSAAMAGQATLTDKIKIKTSGLNSQYEAFQGTVTNIFASMGKVMEPVLTKGVNLMNKLASWLQVFIDKHPKFAQFVLTFIALGSAVLVIAGVVRMVQGLIAVMKILNIVLAMNPFILFVTLAVVAVALLITYWTPITKFFSNLWIGIKKWFWIGVNFIKEFMLSVFVPGYLIFKHWDIIGPYFNKLWNGVKGIFTRAGDWISSIIGPKMFNAGVNIIKSIAKGIWSMATFPVDVLKKVVSNMRDLLPFSPAKTGPFKDLHKIKIVETIAGSIKSLPLVRAMSNVAGAAANALGGKAPSLSGAGGGVTIHYNPVIHIGAGANKDEFMQLLKEHSAEIMRMFDRESKKNNRTKF